MKRPRARPPAQHILWQRKSDAQNGHDDHRVVLEVRMDLLAQRLSRIVDRASGQAARSHGQVRNHHDEREFAKARDARLLSDQRQFELVRCQRFFVRVRAREFFVMCVFVCLLLLYVCVCRLLERLVTPTSAAKAKAGGSVLDLVVTWEIDRKLESCHTPRRNNEVERMLSFFSSLHSWSGSVASYMRNTVFPTQVRERDIRRCCRWIEFNFFLFFFFWFFCFLTSNRLSTSLTWLLSMIPAFSCRYFEF